VSKLIDGPDTLEPGLTKADKRVLAALPPAWRWEGPKAEARTIWEIAETLNALDLVDLAMTLRGLEHLGYVTSRSASRWDGPNLWQRLERGDAVVSLGEKGRA
jgi:hypothetical protein